MLRPFAKRYFPLSTHLGSSALFSSATTDGQAALLSLAYSGPSNLIMQLLSRTFPAELVAPAVVGIAGLGAVRKLGFAPPIFCSGRLAAFVIGISRSLRRTFSYLRRGHLTLFVIKLVFTRAWITLPLTFANRSPLAIQRVRRTRRSLVRLSDETRSRARASSPRRLEPVHSLERAQCCRLAVQEHLSPDREKERAVLLDSREEEEDEEQVQVWPFRGSTRSRTTREAHLDTPGATR